MKHLSILATLALASSLSASVYYVDSEKGNDSAAGFSPATAWQSLQKVNDADLKPGDSVLFKRGGLWRGTLALKSGKPGAPVVYSNYGEGPMPILQCSIAMDNTADWSEIKPGLWKTNLVTKRVGSLMKDFEPATGWGVYCEKGFAAAIKPLKDVPNAVRLSVSEAGEIGNGIQLWGSKLPECNQGLVVTLKMRASRPLVIPTSFTFLQEGRPFAQCSAEYSRKNIGTEWSDVTLVFHTQDRSKEDIIYRLHLNLGGILKAGDYLDMLVVDAYPTQIVSGTPILRDIGNIILDHGKTPCPRKRWSVSEFQDDCDYVYDSTNAGVIIRSDKNPAERFSSIELMQKQSAVLMGNRSYVVVDGFSIRYANFGFSGANTAYITIRNCDISYIGGALQFVRPNGVYVRYGNGIEFWGNCDHNLVENNRIWEVYDAALTNQGHEDTETNITYRNNVIWNSEFSFEYWNKKLTDNIVFENNTCIDAGKGWAHFHRPDPNGAHLMFYGNSAKTTNFFVRNNIFVNTTEQGMRMDIVWLDSITLKHNLWFTDDKPVYRLRPGSPTHRRLIFTKDMKDASAEFHQDEDSLFAKPIFVNPEQRDYRLAPNSPGYGQGFGAAH